jgi:hypothetical protein
MGAESASIVHAILRGALGILSTRTSFAPGPNISLAVQLRLNHTESLLGTRTYLSFGVSHCRARQDIFPRVGYSVTADLQRSKAILLRSVKGIAKQPLA